MSLEYVDDPLQSAPNQELNLKRTILLQPPLMKIADTGFEGLRTRTIAERAMSECGNVALLLFDQAGWLRV